MGRCTWTSLGLTALLGFAGTCAGAPLYTLTHLGNLPGVKAGEYVFAYGINDLGQVVGSVEAPDQRPFIWSPTTPNGSTGSMVDFPDLPDGHTAYKAVAINSSGQVTGQSESDLAHGAVTRAFLWTPTAPNGSSGAIVNLTGQSSLMGAPVGINNRGQVLASSAFGSPDTASILWSPAAPNGSTGSAVNIGELTGGATYAFPGGINSSGQVVGVSTSASGDEPFLWTPSTPNGASGSMVSVGHLPGQVGGGGVAINAAGQVVGNARASASGFHAMLWTPDSPNGATGAMTDLGDFSGGIDFSHAYSVNASGHVVGYGHPANNVPRAFLWTPTDLLQDLNTLVDGSGAGWELQFAWGINDFGQITGYGLYDADGSGSGQPVYRAFLLTPVPEPGTIGSVALLGLLLLRRRRRSKLRSALAMTRAVRRVTLVPCPT
jgi:probable HAF family extracellular repeat protein